MPKPTATTPEQYLASLTPEQRAALTRVRDAIRRRLPAGYEEAGGYGITWQVPLERFPNTYNKQPLPVASLATQKNYNALYLMCVYGDAAREKRLRDAFAQAGKKLDMGKSCVRFRSADDLDLDAIADVIADSPPEWLIERHEAAHAGRRATKKK